MSFVGHVWQEQHLCSATTMHTWDPAHPSTGNLFCAIFFVVQSARLKTVMVSTTGFMLYGQDYKKKQLWGIFMLHMAPSYLSAGYQELRNPRGTGEVALRQGVIASTNQTIYGMFTERLGINMLQEKGCLV